MLVIYYLFLFCFHAVKGRKKLIMELSQNRLHVHHAEIVTFSISMLLVISITMLWNQISSAVPAVHQSCTKPSPTLHTWMPRCSSILPLIAIGTDQQLLDALQSSTLLSCIKTMPTTFTQLQMVSVVVIVVIERVTGIDQLIGNCHLLQLKLGYIFQLKCERLHCWLNLFKTVYYRVRLKVQVLFVYTYVNEKMLMFYFFYI